MSDDDGGWDDDDFEVPDVTKLTLARDAPVRDKFADEDAETAEERAAREHREREIAALRAKTTAAKKVKEIKSAVSYEDDDDALRDPAAEKARRQRLVEEADLRAARELFGGGDVELETFEPKGKGDFEKLGSAVAHKYLSRHEGGAHYVHAIKALLRVATRELTAADVKEVEVAVVAARTDKVKKEKAEAEAAKKAAANSKKGKFLNAGGGKTGAGGGLDDFKYAVDSVDDEYDFM
ncbi:translation initiation factor eIF3, p35 subunit [Ostreococcus tauri]|uniref:Translation initiation factor eIF3, p35 subunit n=1 Tax=Ostreococcus tauri TaxID=70448 RepID=A0A1Y5I8D4_OSTTA|nr:translation initiation factor eIF3, p35 subunit [Ostreococcus tauri]